MKLIKNKYVTSVFAGLLSVTSSYASEGVKEQNLIRNADFETGKEGWNIWHVKELSSELKLEDGYAKVINTTFGDQWFQIKLSSPSFLLKKGIEYKVSADVWLDKGSSSIAFKLMGGNAPYTNYHTVYKDCTNEKKNHSFTFIMDKETDKYSKLSFGLGKYKGNINIDNVVVTRVKQ